MQFVFFTKALREYGIDQVIDALKRIGADGADLAVRPGYPVTPENAPAELPKAAERLRDAGLTVPMISLPTEPTDPMKAEPIFAACREARIPNIKLGYWPFRDGPYWAQVDAARKDLDALEALAMRFKVKVCLHTHSGRYLGLNTSAVMHLVRDRHPQHVGVYIDAGHLAVCGEPLPMAVAIAAKYLSLVAVKDVRWDRPSPDKPWTTTFLPVGQGIVDWPALMAALKASGYAGAISFHSEFAAPSTEALLDQTKADIAFLRSLAAKG